MTFTFTHRVDILVLPSCLAAEAAAAAAAAEVAAAVVAEQSRVPEVRRRRMKRTWRRTKRSMVVGRSEGTGSSGLAPLTGSSEINNLRE